MKKQLVVILVSILFVLSLVLTGCQKTISAADTITIGTTDKIASLDPADAYSMHDWEIIKNISDGLLKWTPGTNNLEADLATDLGTASADGLTYTFTLKDGIKFGDGTALTAKIYAAQLNRLLTIGPKCPDDVADSLVVPFVKSIAAPDDKTLVFTLTTPIAYFRELLASAPYVASDPKTFKTDATACTMFPTAPVYGTGPWYVSKYNADESMTLLPNPYYTGSYKPQVKEVIVRVYADPSTLSLAAQSGEVDVAWRTLSTEQLTKLKTVANLKIGTIAGGRIQFLNINHNMKPFDDLNVDKAVASSIDRNEIADTVYNGDVTPLYSGVPAAYSGTNVFDTMYSSPNIDAAKKFLEASGYSATNPCQITLWYPPEHYGASTAAWVQLLKKQLEASGEIQVTLSAQEWSTYSPAITGGKYDVGVEGWFFDYPDASNYLDPFVYNGGMGTGVTAAKTGSTTGTPKNDQITKLVALLSQADIEQDATKRADEYKQAESIYADQVVTLPLFFSAEHVVYQKNISGTASQASPDTLNIGGNIEFNYSLLQKK